MVATAANFVAVVVVGSMRAFSWINLEKKLQEYQIIIPFACTIIEYIENMGPHMNMCCPQISRIQKWKKNCDENIYNYFRIFSLLTIAEAFSNCLL